MDFTKGSGTQIYVLKIFNVKMNSIISTFRTNSKYYFETM
jgi:hypothetical protein